MRREQKRRRPENRYDRLFAGNISHGREQTGTGLLSALGALMIARRVGEKILPDSDENARPGFSGENHSLLKLKGLKMGVGNYIGNGTHIAERIARGDPPRTEIDRVAQAHDLRYFQAKTEDDIVAADRKMIAAVKMVKAKNLDSSFNIAQTKLIDLKMKFLSKGAFGDLANAGARKMTPLMEAKLSELEQTGYGMDAPREEPICIDHVAELKKRMLKFSRGKSR